MTLSADGFFDSDLIARLGHLELVAKRIVDGFLAGKNRSSRHGFSVEFVEHREYVPGDDLRHLDWKVLGRMDRYYIKRYEEETNITAVIVLDASKSMTYRSEIDGTAGMSKFEMAATAAAGLGYLLHRQRDAVGLAIHDSEMRAFVPPSSRAMALANIVARLRGTEPDGKTSFKDVLERAALELPRRCLFILVSDFFLPIEEIEAGLKFLHYRGHDGIVLQTLDKAEREFPFESNVLFKGLEDDRELLTEPHRLRERYLGVLETFLAGLRKTCEAHAFDYQLLTTGESLSAALATLIAARSRRRGGAASSGRGGR